ncbi:hypothetical protein GA0074695_2447 [Micromonospora viridifaciens]|uniref:Uncharacterized protein n=1 Tax=Micromonospora viridifaciens TaxID=1881 RepID=A0A1C4WHM5_MICVI|nr:hypothetical protein [Micromonospora viridifaciens]SCE95649.1 hypothetical protein GA0074695_2447 [Micromonospora viridifaciens]
MANIDVDQLKRVLSAEKTRADADAGRLRAVNRALRRVRPGPDFEARHRRALERAFRTEMPDAARYFAEAEETFRRGVRDRRTALDVLATAPPPLAPTSTLLETPFLIWGLAAGSPGSRLRYDGHIEAGNSWATMASYFDGDGAFLTYDEVDFYFLWQNDGGTDVVVDVQSLLRLTGSLHAWADAGFFWTPFWGVTTIGDSTGYVQARLELLQWWEQPPTRPLPQPDQVNDVESLSVSGGWQLLGRPGRHESVPVSGAAHLAYDTFRVPAGAVAVFEVGVRVGWGGYDGGGFADFESGDFRVVCPHVQLEFLTAPPVVSP